MEPTGWSLTRREADETFGAPTSPVEPDLGVVEEVADLIGHAIHLGLHEPVGVSLQGRRRRGAMGSRIFQFNCWGGALTAAPGAGNTGPALGVSLRFGGVSGNIPRNCRHPELPGPDTVASNPGGWFLGLSVLLCFWPVVCGHGGTKV